MKLNSNAVVPTLIHDGHVITESSLILYYLDDAFPENPLMPIAALDLVKVRMVNKFIDEYLHNSCMILTFATAFRPAFLRMSPPDREAQFSRSAHDDRNAMVLISKRKKTSFEWRSSACKRTRPISWSAQK
jgi:glutathione S-transferase